MNILTDSQFLAHVEAFLAKHDISQTRFGIDAMADGGLVPGLREGRSLSLKNAERVLRFMDGFERAQAA